MGATECANKYGTGPYAKEYAYVDEHGTTPVATAISSAEREAKRITSVGSGAASSQSGAST